MKRTTLFISLLACFSLFRVSAQYDPAPVSTLGSVSTYGSTVVVPVIVVSFDSIGSCDLTVEYDPLIVTPIAVTKEASIPGILDWGISTSGVLTWSWYMVGGEGLTLEDNSVIFTITFSKVADGTTQVQWDNESLDGTLCIWFNSDFEYLIDIPTEEYYIGCSVIFMSYNAPDTYAATIFSCSTGSMVYVPVTVANFNDIGSFSLTMTYDTAVLDYIGFIFPSPPFPGLTVDVPEPGGVIYSWGYSSDEGITYGGVTMLYTLIFNYKGGSTDLQWVSTNDTDCEYTYYPDYAPLNDDPFNEYYYNGWIGLAVLPTAVITNNTGVTELTCITTTINVTASGGVSYSWSDGTTEVSTDSLLAITYPATFTVTVFDLNNCSDTASIIITQDTAAPVAVITNNTGYTELTCYIPSISLTASGGVSYSWYKGAVLVGNDSSITVTDPGIFTVIVSAANGCTDTESIAITQDITTPTAIITNISGTTLLTCTTTSINLIASGGVSYSWSDGVNQVGTDANLVITLPGTYTVTVIAANGCSDTESVVITQDIQVPDAVITNNTGVTELTWDIASISVTASGGVSYSWSDGTTELSTVADLLITAPGTYTVTVTAANGCVDAESIVITSAITAINEMTIDRMILTSYPNPFHEEIYINYTIPTDGKTTFRLLDVFGKPVIVPINATQTRNDYHLFIDAASLHTGVYTAILTLDTGIRILICTNKVIKQ